MRSKASSPWAGETPWRRLSSRQARSSAGTSVSTAMPTSCQASQLMATVNTGPRQAAWAKASRKALPAA
jgi:hypothetical protein